jgi:NADH dehydrogenase
VVLGAGFGGLNVAKDLADVPVDVVVVDANNFHTFQPLLYQVATAGLGPDDIAQPVRRILRRHRSVDVVLGRVDSIDLEARSVHTAEGVALTYDHLVVAVGAVTADYGIPGVNEHALGLKTLPDAVRVRNHILNCFEEANRIALRGGQPDPALLTFVVVGGGPTGVEVAGELAEVRRAILAKEFRDIDASGARLVLVEAADHLLRAFHPRLRERARRALVARGVEVRLGTAIEQISEGGVVLAGGEELPARTLIWAAGVRAHPLGSSLVGELTADGRVPVDEHLCLPGRPEVRVIGDLAAARDRRGRLLPQLAPVAIQEAHHVAASITSEVTGRPGPKPFQYRDRGIMATIGRSEAVAQFRPNVRLSGFLGWVAWLGLHLIELIGFRNRANVLVNWAWNYLTYDRGARLILENGR